MDLPRRKRLPHDVPLWIDTWKEIFFITVNCQSRGGNHLARPDVAEPLLDTVRYRNEQFIWFAHLFLVMPDHVHGLFSFPPSKHALKQTMTLWKRWTARELGIQWQGDFFEHRLRSEESLLDRSDYILANPARKGLVKEPKDWPFVFLPR